MRQNLLRCFPAALTGDFDALQLSFKGKIQILLPLTTLCYAAHAQQICREGDQPTFAGDLKSPFSNQGINSRGPRKIALCDCHNISHLTLPQSSLRIAYGREEIRRSTRDARRGRRRLFFSSSFPSPPSLCYRTENARGTSQLSHYVRRHVCNRGNNCNGSSAQ